MLQRTSIDSVNKKLKENPNWKVLDIGCGYTANENATVVSDVQDLSNFYKNKKFVKITEKKLPFKDNEFDFVITSHVIEHVDDFQFFISEIERISKKGYIELPTKLGDNLVFENSNDHLWMFEYDDNSNILLASKKQEFIEPFVSVSTAKKLEKIFRQSLILEIIWSDKIDYKIISNEVDQILKRINFKDLSSINKGLNELINLTRENKMSPSDLSGGVISISNLGSYNIRSFDAIILPGQTYILAVGQIFEDVFVNKGKIEIASFVNLTLSCDHRAVDGVLAAQFLSSIVTNLEKINND